MLMDDRKSVISQIQAESNQSPDTRTNLIKYLEDHFESNVILFFTSSRHPVAIGNEDTDVIETILQKFDRNKKTILVLNSPGGSAVAAERIINGFRTYSPKGFEVIVPHAAKSAATMICLGADKIYMSKTSELGAIDPQVIIKTHDDRHEYRGAYFLVEGYNTLFSNAIKQDQGSIQPYLQQLNHYDHRDIIEWERAIKLGDDIVIRLLESGMLRGMSQEDIKDKIKPFTDPEKTLTHSRPIFIDEARSCGIAVEEINIESELWKTLWELYLRASGIVNTDKVAKIVESIDLQLAMAPPRFIED